MTNDTERLQRFVECRDQAAFESIVREHLGIVYGAACRRLGHRAHLAEDVCQKVFTLLAQRAPSLLDHPALGAWLHRCARNVSLNVIRREQRAEKLSSSLAAMSDSTPDEDGAIDWDRCRPVLDEEIDQLKEKDRQILILRFFSGLSFAEISERMGLKENTARMRANRALERLRRNLASRGVLSSSAALAALLEGPALTAAPSELAAGIVTAVISSPPTGVFTSLATLLSSSNVLPPIIGAGLGAAITALVWQVFPPVVSPDELRALRSENNRLTQLVSLTLPARVHVVAQTLAARHSTRVNPNEPNGRLGSPQLNTLNHQPSARSARGHVYRGQDTPTHAAQSFAYACDAADLDALTKLLWFAAADRARAKEILSTMPASIQAQYPTIESFYALALAADALIYPPPSPEKVSTVHEVVVRPGLVTIRKNGSDKNGHFFQETPEGWKFVVPAIGVERWPGNLNNELLVRLGIQGER